jgi:hypothetical protein
MSPPPGSRIWATINYGWEPMEFYERWMGTDKHAEGCQGPYLDPLNPQTEYAPFFLRLVKAALKDETYVERLRRHYQLFKQAIETEGRPRRRPQKKQSEGKRRRLRLVKK